MKQTEAAFHWVVDTLESLHIPFQVTGGLAARVYGSDRELADIDIDIPEECILTITEYAKPWVVYGPERYVNDTFDMVVMTIEKDGQEIDIAGFGSGKIFQKSTGMWIPDKVHLIHAERMIVFGREVPVIAKHDLIAYKQSIAREVDIEDIRQIGSAHVN
jgi:predicted nucleotidyltransferase